ncbi:class I SAM-dependent methyltransferase [bacterium]|nr:class I SAM-dependent methyltransferase [bacterium]
MSKAEFRELKGVARTMILPLYARASESKRARPILRDPRAQQILEQLNCSPEELADLEKESKILPVVACVAATIYDRWISDFLDQHPTGTIVEIGPGLDTRYERLDNGQATWIDIDLPESLAVRRRFFEENQRRMFLAESILDEGWVEIVRERARPPILFAAEGVLFYFKEEDVRALFTRVADHFPGSLFLHDSCVRGVAANSSKIRLCQVGGASFQWGIDDIKEIEAWDPRFHVEEIDSVLYHYRNRYPWMVRLVTWIIPGIRRVFTVNKLRLGTTDAGRRLDLA